MRFSSPTRSATQRPTASTLSPTRGPLPQRKCTCGGTVGPTGECDRCREKRLQREAAAARINDSGTSPSADVLRSSGQPLAGPLRRELGAHLGHDFTAVRVHTGERAAASARSVNAVAYTVGHNVVFDSGHYQPTTPTGRRLLTHELAHVVQQTGRAGATVSSPTRLEHEANAAAGAPPGAARPLGLSSAGPTPVLQRQPAPGTPTTPPSTAANECSGWEQDPQSFAIHLARHVGKTYLDPSVEVAASGGHPSCVCIDDRHCDVMLSNGVRIRATWQPSTRIALARYEDADDESHRFLFNYSCAKDGRLVLDFKQYIKGDHHSVPSPPPQPRSWRDRVKDWFRPPIPIAPRKAGATQP